MLKNFIHTAAQAVALLVCGIAAGYFLLVLVCLLPVEQMQANLADSAAVFAGEKEYHRVIPGYVSTQLDNYTDSWMVGIAVYDSGLPAWKQALACTRAESGDGPLGSLVSYLAGTETTKEVGYARYWHGYLVVLKPFFLFFDYADLRVVNIALQFALVLAIFGTLIGMGRRREAVGYAVSVLFIMPVVVPLSIQFSVIFYVANGAALILLRCHKKLCGKGRMLLYFQLIGMAASFFDLLTYPIASLGVPLVCLMVMEQENALKEKVKEIVSLSVSWGFGYAAMWAGKWVLATLVLKENIISDALSQIGVRAAHVQEEGELTVLEIWLRNVEFYFEKPYIVILLLCVAATLVGLVRNRHYIRQIVADAVPYLIVAAMPFVWYAFAGQHSYEHHWFTFRGLMGSVFACMCIWAQAGRRNSREDAL